MSGKFKEQKVTALIFIFLQTSAEDTRTTLPETLTWSFEVGCFPAHPEWVISRCSYVYWLQLTQSSVCLVVSCLLKRITESLIYNVHRGFSVIRGRISVVGYISWAEFFNCSYLTCPRQWIPEEVWTLQSGLCFFFHSFGVDPYKLIHGRVFCPPIDLGVGIVI